MVDDARQGGNYREYLSPRRGDLLKVKNPILCDNNGCGRILRRGEIVKFKSVRPVYGQLTYSVDLERRDGEVVSVPVGWFNLRSEDFAYKRRKVAQ